ncbi:MAG: hypothetical protein KF805_02035 [Phycisphaeraceae bacterium]|nr:hypothetical protein [Phycisphaeraceae bacterium]
MRSLVRIVRDLARNALPALTLVLGVAVALAPVGCASKVIEVPIAGLEVLEHTPTIAVDADNIRGAVLIRVNPRLTAPRVTANAGTKRGEPLENSEGVKWAKAQITENDGRAILTVRSVPGSVEEGQPEAWVQLKIEIPSCDGIRVKNSDGAIEVRGVNGAINIDNGGAGRPGGSVYVEVGKPNTSPIIVNTERGDIDLILPTDSTGKVELISGSGALAAIVAWTGQVTNSSIKPGLYTGILNWGENPIRLKTVDGQVRMHVGPYRFGNPQNKYYYQ